MAARELYKKKCFLDSMTDLSLQTIKLLLSRQLSHLPMSRKTLGGAEHEHLRKRG